MIFLSIWDVLSCSSIWIALLVPGERLERDRRGRSPAGLCCRQRISIIWRIKQNFQTSDQLLMLTQFFLLNKRGNHLAARIPIFKKIITSFLLHIHLHKLLERNISISVLVNPLHQTPHPVLVCGEKDENYQNLTEIFPPTNTPCWWKAALYSSAVRTPSPSWQWTTPARTTFYTCHSPCLPGRRPSSALLSGPQWPAERNVNVLRLGFHLENYRFSLPEKPSCVERHDGHSMSPSPDWARPARTVERSSHPQYQEVSQEGLEAGSNSFNLFTGKHETCGEWVLTLQKERLIST